ncbi:TetR/AcrR family transcriptional regulator [Nocardia cyriacigeorgica]|nr:TetR/AcrR family transcriptional regulator [Nocardia cyriacigeorgica]
MPQNSSTTSGRPYAGESHEDRAERRTRQLLDAGFELFGTVGYRATTVRALCREAKVTDRYFYKSFANTEELMAAVYQRCIERLTNAIIGRWDAMASTDLDEMITLGLDAFYAAVEDRRLARIIWLEILGASPQLDQVYDKTLSGLLNVIPPAVLDTFRQPGLDDEHARIIAIALIGAINTTGMAWYLRGYDTPREVIVAAMKRLITRHMT